MGPDVLVDIQVASAVASVPDESEMQSWVAEVVQELAVERECEVSIRIVDEEESRALNRQYRDIDKATNVLSFSAGSELPADLTPGLPYLLGDIVICGPIVEREAKAQHKDAAAHWAHLLVHGTLHLLGHDHEAEAQAEVMESIETRILARWGVADPYAPRSAT
jgi:probable rRNA maturation factor